MPMPEAADILSEVFLPEVYICLNNVAFSTATSATLSHSAVMPYFCPRGKAGITPDRA